MRIALSHKLYRVTGGAEVFFREAERVLRERGHETLMIASGIPSEAEGVANVHLTPAPDYESPSTLTKIKCFPSAVYDPGKGRYVERLLKEFKPDVFHAFTVNVHLSPSVVVAASRLGIPVVGSFNDYKHLCPNFKLFRDNKICTDCKGGHFYHAIQHRCCKGKLVQSAASAVEAYVHKWLGIYDYFDHFTFSSEFMARKTEEFWAPRRVSWSKFRNPFDSVAVKAEDVYEDYCLYFGRLVPEKGVDRLIRAASKINGFPVKIVGDGPELGPLKALAAELKADNVEFLGPRWGDELSGVLNRALFVVVPSTWNENFPYVINQSFAAARPVIGADRGGITELVSHGDRGLIFDPDDIEQLAERMRELIDDRALARKMGQAAKKWSDGIFRDDVAYDDLMNAYETAANEHRRPRR